MDCWTQLLDSVCQAVVDTVSWTLTLTSVGVTRAGVEQTAVSSSVVWTVDNMVTVRT